MNESRFGALPMVLLIGYIGLMVVANFKDSDVDVNLNMPIWFFRLVQVLNVIIIFVIPSILFLVFTRSRKDLIQWKGFKYFIKDNSRHIISSLRLNNKPSFQQVFFGALTIVCAFPLVNWIQGIVKNIHLPNALADIEARLIHMEKKYEELMELFLNMDGPIDLFVNLMMIGVLAAVSEEVFFRGILQRHLMDRTRRPHAAIWISSFLFALMHFQYHQVVTITLLGALLGYLYWWSGSLWVPIATHFLNNAISVIMKYFIGKNELPPEAESFGTGKTEFIAVAISTALVVSLLFRFYKISKSKRRREELSNLPVADE